jgi:hypothetical protein
LADLGIDGRVILKCILKKWVVRGSVASSCECSERLGSIKEGEISSTPMQLSPSEGQHFVALLHFDVVFFVQFFKPQWPTNNMEGPEARGDGCL